MIYFLIFSIELVALYFLSGVLMVKIFRFFFWLTKNKTRSVYLFSLTFLPGTFIHEAAHFLSALLLLVPVGEIKLLPEVTSSNSIKMGEVPIAKTDIVRRFLIGVAPPLIGTGVLLLTVYFWISSGAEHLWWKDILVAYVVFEVGNTMFASKKDMEGAVELLFVLLVFGLIGYAAGINILSVFTFFPESTFENIFQVFSSASFFLVIPIIIDSIILLIFHLLAKYMRIKL